MRTAMHFRYNDYFFMSICLSLTVQQWGEKGGIWKRGGKEASKGVRFQTKTHQCQKPNEKSLLERN